MDFDLGTRATIHGLVELMNSVAGPEVRRSYAAAPQGWSRQPDRNADQAGRMLADMRMREQCLVLAPARNAAGGRGFRWESAGRPTAAGSARGHQCGRGARGRWAFPGHRH